MSIEFSCGHCGTHLRVGEEKAGVEATCPKCGQSIRIPEVSRRDGESPAREQGESHNSVAADSEEASHQAMPHGEAQQARFRPTDEGPFRPQTGIVWTVTLGMALMLVAHLSGTAATLFQWILLKQLKQGIDVPQGDLELSDLLVGGAAVVYLLALLGTCVCWMVWKSGANRNARRLSDQHFEYTPGWTVGCYFVPFANLVWPYQAMKEIWNASAPAGTSAGLVGWWWGLWLINGVLGRISVRMSRDAETVEALIRSDLFDLAVSPVEIAVILVAGTLVWRIHRMQLVKAGYREGSFDGYRDA